MQKTNQDKTVEPQKTKIWQTLVIVFLCLLPFLLASIPFLQKGQPLSAYTSIYSDEIDYWAEAISISQYGLTAKNTGYFGYNANNTAKVLNYGPHSFFSLMPYALVGKVFNAQPVMMLATNMLLISLATLIFYLLTRSLKKTALLTLLLYTFSPFLYYIFTSMIELLIFACMIVLCALYYKSLNEEEKPFYRKLYIALVIIFSLFRVTIIFFLVPIFIKEIFDKPKKWWWASLKFVLIALSVAIIVSITSAVYPWWFHVQLLESSNKIVFFFRHGFSSSIKFFLPAYNSPIELVFNYTYILWFAFLSISFFKRIRTLNNTERNFQLGQITIQAFNLIFILFLYDFNELAGFRFLTPVLFFSVLSVMTNQTISKPKKWAAALSISIWLALMIAFIPISGRLYKDQVDRRLQPKPKIQLFSHIPFNPVAKDRWENTIYMDIFAFTYLDYGSFEPGLGMMYFRADELDDILAAGGAESLKARYIISSSDWTPPGYKPLHQDNGIHLFLKMEP